MLTLSGLVGANMTFGHRGASGVRILAAYCRAANSNDSNDFNDSNSNALLPTAVRGQAVPFRSSLTPTTGRHIGAISFASEFKLLPRV